MASKPTARSLDWARKRGWVASVAERYCSFTRRRHDLFEFVDIVAISIEPAGIVAIQTTSGTNVAARIAKIESIDAARSWLMAGGQIEVHGWAKRGKAGKRKPWKVRRVAVYLDCGALVTREI